MARPIIERLRKERPVLARAAELAIEAIEERRGQPLAPATRDSVAAEAAVAMASDPVVMNGTNNEPWYQSRIILGLITMTLGFALRVAGADVTAEDEALIQSALPIVGEGISALGLLIAAIGRLAKNMKPINWRKPWTIFGRR